MPPFISSITIERLNRAGQKIFNELDEEKRDALDIGYKVFDSVEAPKLELDSNNQMIMKFENITTLSRIYNMIFTVGLDEPTTTPQEVVKECMYKVGSNYYVTNSDKLDNEDFLKAINSDKVFIDGWSANLNTTLQNYKEDIRIVF